ncbi:MAG: hypothetical protein BGN97_07990 [Microbacterium sp. 69-10]|mgnify:CR=1 FL=1|uniref:MGMT family protein n=1 Tax=Microbacterium sp. 69-10 TaxID=1895783 RepID=UPI0009687F13|nr:MGMT family protein [Microbacterium sp. 69-10]OJU40937.1 MAG: hypothetical protein BGN97_07990 [Microbacterium sp. 69-10]
MTFRGAIETPVGVVAVESDGAAVTRVTWPRACHRVVASDGLGGYSGGRDGEGLLTKRWLLEHEGALPTALF